MAAQGACRQDGERGEKEWCCEGGLNSRPRHYQCVFRTLGLSWIQADEVVSGSITDCFIWDFHRVGFAWWRTWLVSVVLRSPTIPLLMTPPPSTGVEQVALPCVPLRRSWRPTPQTRLPQRGQSEFSKKSVVPSGCIADLFFHSFDFCVH